MTPWLTVIGIGDGGLGTLTPEQHAALDAAEVVFGGARHLAMLRETGREMRAWASPFSAALDALDAVRQRPVVVLASGDPSWFGVAGTLSGRYPQGEMHVLPSPSSFSLAASRLGWRLEEVACLSVHGRPLSALQGHVLPRARLLVLAENGRTPEAVAAMLVARGYGESRITLLEHLGGPLERVRAATAAGFAAGDIADLVILAIDCVADVGAPLFPAVAGLPDDAFVHDGKMTKRVARALAIAALAPHPGAVLWDVGAGCGSVSVEWMRACRGASAMAIEPVEARRAMIAENAAALGAPSLAIVAGKAPEAFAHIEGAPDAVFLGGGLSDGVFGDAFARLAPGGRMVAHAVTLESERLLLDLHARLGGELMRIEVQRAEPVGPFRGWRPSMPVLHWHLTKRAEAPA